MDAQSLLLALVVATALIFDFTNGFHDTGNAMATSIATEALTPRRAVLLAAVLNFVGALLSLSVAATIAKGIVEPGAITLVVVFAGLIGGISWNLFTWYLGIPSSSSHALIGGMVGATIVAAGVDAVQGYGLLSSVLIPAVLAPVTAALVAAIGTYLVYAITRRVTAELRDNGFRIGQIGSASLVALAHGTNDAQKTMGVITLALIANGSLTEEQSTPLWVILSCALAISLGTYSGGWRVIRTMGKGLVRIEPPQGFAAEGSSAAVILSSSFVGFPLSTTQVCTGSIVGSGLGRHHGRVRWSVAARMATAWVVTLPAAGLVGGAAFALANGIGGPAGVLAVSAIALALALIILAAARRTPVNAGNVNAEWAGSVTPERTDLPTGV